MVLSTRILLEFTKKELGNIKELTQRETQSSRKSINLTNHLLIKRYTNSLDASQIPRAVWTTQKLLSLTSLELNTSNYQSFSLIPLIAFNEPGLNTVHHTTPVSAHDLISLKSVQIKENLMEAFFTTLQEFAASLVVQTRELNTALSTPALSLLHGRQAESLGEFSKQAKSLLDEALEVERTPNMKYPIGEFFNIAEEGYRKMQENITILEETLKDFGYEKRPLEEGEGERLAANCDCPDSTSCQTHSRTANICNATTFNSNILLSRPQSQLQSQSLSQSSLNPFRASSIDLIPATNPKTPRELLTPPMKKVFAEVNLKSPTLESLGISNQALALIRDEPTPMPEHVLDWNDITNSPNLCDVRTPTLEKDPPLRTSSHSTNSLTESGELLRRQLVYKDGDKSKLEYLEIRKIDPEEFKKLGYFCQQTSFERLNNVVMDINDIIRDKMNKARYDHDTVWDEVTAEELETDIGIGVLESREKSAVLLALMQLGRIEVRGSPTQANKRYRIL